MTVRWIFLCRCHWQWQRKAHLWKRRRGAFIYHLAHLFLSFLLRIFRGFFLPKCSWGRCRKCWRGPRGRCCTTKEVVIESTKEGLRNTFMNRKDHQTRLQESQSYVHTSQDGKSEQDQKIKVHPREAGFSLKDTAAYHRLTEICCPNHFIEKQNPGLSVVVVA